MMPPRQQKRRASGTPREPDRSRHLAETEALAGFGRWSWSSQQGPWCSEGLLTILGMADARVRLLLRRIPLQQRRMLIAALRQARCGQPPTAVEFRLHGVDDRWRNCTAWIRRDPDGSLWGIVQDITALRSMSTALERSESRWEIALQSAHQGVWDSDVETGFVYHSRTWRTRCDIDGHCNCWEILLPMDR